MCNNENKNISLRRISESLHTRHPEPTREMAHGKMRSVCSGYNIKSSKLERIRESTTVAFISRASLKCITCVPVTSGRVLAMMFLYPTARKLLVHICPYPRSSHGKLFVTFRMLSVLSKGKNEELDKPSNF